MHRPRPRPRAPITWERARTAVLVAVAFVLVSVVVPGGAAELRGRAGGTIDPAVLADPGAYRDRGFFDVKGLQPDFWADRAEVAPGLGSVTMNLFWAEWEPVVQLPPCAPATQVERGGRCYTIPAGVEAEIRGYTELGVAVIAIVYGTPAWARGTRPCEPVAPGFEVFCTPDDPADYGRFVGMLADRYDGAGGFGRITDVVVQNEVNANQWFNIGCGAGTPCDLDEWVASYAELYNEAYDAVRAAQPRARVLFSFTQHLQPVLDSPELDHPIWSVQTFTSRLVPLVGDREWSVAIHPYPRNLFVTEIDARDLPWVTMGNVGAVVGWLRAEYPDDPHAWEVQLTEVGFHNAGGTQDAEQVGAVCRSLRNVLGTPGITTFIYHRMRDHPDEGLLALGLRGIDGSPKPAWATWRHSTDADAPRCGFERYPNTVVQHGVHPTTGDHWFSSRDLPAGYAPVGQQWLLSYDERPGTAMLHECGAGDGTYLWRNAACDGDVPMGPVGWIATEPGAGRTALFACTSPQRRIATTAVRCAPGEAQLLLGYVDGEPEAPPTTTTTAVPTTTPPAGATPVVATPTFTG